MSEGGIFYVPFIEARALEKEFLDALATCGPLDCHVQELTRTIRCCYESIILTDHDFANSHEVERSLWALHYKQIYEFRRCISNRNVKGLLQVQNKTTECDEERPKIILRREPVSAAFKIFLHETSNFYAELMCKIRAQCGLSFNLSDWFSTERSNESNALDLKRCRFYCHRCLVRLGDCARYMEAYLGSGNDFLTAICYYKRALSLLPSNGHPHNQFAVMALASGDILLAVYHHLRSLSVENPFSFTRENMKSLFLQYQDEYGKTHKEEESEFTNLFGRFVYLVGILFTGKKLERFEEIFSALLLDFNRMLQLDDGSLEEALSFINFCGAGRKDRGEAGALKLVFILICSVDDIRKRYIEDETQRDCLLGRGIVLFVEITGRFMQRCVESCGMHAGDLLLPAVLVALEWLACEMSVAQMTFIRDDHCAWSSFWRQCISLLNRYSNIKCDNLEAFADHGISCSGTMLWEDKELQGFSALAAAHLGLDLSREDPLDPDDSKSIRISRLLAAGKAIAFELEQQSIGSAGRMVFDEDYECFSFINNDVLAGRKEDGIQGEAECEYEEEVIMYKPVIKDGPCISVQNEYIGVDLESREPSGVEYRQNAVAINCKKVLDEVSSFCFPREIAAANLPVQKDVYKSDSDILCKILSKPVTNLMQQKCAQEPMRFSDSIVASVVEEVLSSSQERASFPSTPSLGFCTISMYSSKKGCVSANVSQVGKVHNWDVVVGGNRKLLDDGQKARNEYSLWGDTGNIQAVSLPPWWSVSIW